MLSVSILVNGKPIYTRTAVNVADLKNGRCRYRLDDGSIVEHDPAAGAAALAIQMLKTIHEVGVHSEAK